MNDVPFRPGINSLTRELEFPEELRLNEWARHVIERLLVKNCHRRLGAGQTGTDDVLQHPWFADLDWDALRNQKVKAPYVPDINGAEDMSHYDAYPDENIEEELDTDASVYAWCEDF